MDTDMIDMIKHTHAYRINTHTAIHTQTQSHPYTHTNATLL